MMAKNQDASKAAEDGVIDELMPKDEDLLYEEELLRNPYSLKMWWRYIQARTDATAKRRYLLYERALRALPGSYKKFIRQPGVPVETAVRVYRRYLKLEPQHVEEYIAYLKAKGLWGEAARKLADVLNDDTFRSLEGKSKHQLWLELCDIITKHPKDVDMRVDAILRGGIRKFTDEVGRLWTSLADYYIRRGMFEKARDVYEEGLQSVITVHDFSLIFDALTQFEESLLSAKMEQLGDDDDVQQGDAMDEDGNNGEDFLLKDDGNDIDLRLARLEHLMSRRPELLSSVVLRQNPHNVHEWHKRVKLFEGNPTKQILTYTEAVKTVDAEKAVGKPYTLWIAFARFYERHGDVPNARIIFEKAVQVQFKYVDDLAQVWADWVEMELQHKNFRRAVELLRRATAEPQRPKRLTHEEERLLPPQQRLYRNLKLWSLYADLEESLGTIESARAVYDRVLELRIATPQIILNYAAFLQEHKFWEDSFQVYERGIALFKYPHVKEIWHAYLKQFVDRYGGKKLERARDLFEHALSQAPPEESKPIYLQYALLEEQHGLTKHAMDIYARAARNVSKKERLSVYELYVAKASEFYGIGKVREIYEGAIEAEPPHDLADADVRSVCLRYAELEAKLGEIDRARAIFVHASALCNPSVEKGFWDRWKDFEVKHGNEDTFREMLRIKRSVATSFSHTQINSAVDAANLTAENAAEPAGTKRAAPEDIMAALEEQALGGSAAEAGPAATRTLVSGFVSAGVIQHGQPNAGKAAAAGGATAGATATNPEEIDLDVDAAGDAEAGGSQGGGDEEDEVDERTELQTRAVPAGVFGSLAPQTAQQQPEEQLGALDRFKRRKVQ